MHAADERRLPFLADMWRDPTRAHRGFAIAKRVAFVETAVPRAAHPAASLQHDPIERGGQGPFVVQIRAAQHD